MPADGFIAIVIVAMLFIGAPAVILHYVTQWKKTGGLQPDDEHMLEDIWRSARSMERRIEALEAILDAEAPGWRRREEDKDAMR
ncbi:MAG: envelope stress response membrane protein PspB [Caulobacterales bacterium]|nr:envelope stress response membrane protein PspB [Caulobacterales bacterium]